MDCGTILYDREFQFSDSGGIIDKWAIVICEAGDAHYVFYTTTNPARKSANVGCNAGDPQPNYYVEAGTAFFPKNTWILLHLVTEIPGYLLDAKLADGKVLDIHFNPLANETLLEILRCAEKSKYIDNYYKGFIREEIERLSPH